MKEYRLFVQSMYDRSIGFYETYGIAIFENGNPDFVTETFVYKTEDGYKCLHSHNAYILGDAKWDRYIEFYRITPTIEGVIGAVQEFGSYDTVRYPGDEKYYKADDFTNKVFE